MYITTGEKEAALLVERAETLLNNRGYLRAP